MTIRVDGAIAGLIQFWEETEPKYRHASVDLFLDPALHGRGIGTDALRCLVRHLIEDRGHHRVTIDPAVDNAAAIRSYEKAGFRRIGVMRAYERDVGGAGWHDGLLMERIGGRPLTRRPLGQARRGARLDEGGLELGRQALEIAALLQPRREPAADRVDRAGIGGEHVGQLALAPGGARRVARANQFVALTEHAPPHRLVALAELFG